MSRSRNRTFATTAYRYPREHLILTITIILVLLVIALTATATVCLSVLFILGMLAFAYMTTRSRHEQLLQTARRAKESPALDDLVRLAFSRIRPGPVDVFVAPSDTLNAYTFGLTSPKVVVLQSPLLEVMDREELLFVIGHEMGHVALGHTWLNSLVGGIAGIPSPFMASALLSLAFLWWNRACEFSADRAGMLACGSPAKATSALVKLAAGESIETRAELEQVLRHIQAEDDNPLSNLGEALRTHPMTVRRIEELQRYARSAEYRRLQALINRNTYPQ